MGIVRPLAVLVVAGAVVWLGYGKLAEPVPLPSSLSVPLPGTEQVMGGAAGVAGDDGPTAAGSVPVDGEGEGLPDDPAASPERRFARALDAAAEQAGELVRLGETKSRDLPRILDEQGRMTARLDEIDALIASGSLPTDEAEAVAAYESGSRAVRDAMDQAQTGFLRFDFGKVREATDRLRGGERDLARAAGLLPE